MTIVKTWMMNGGAGIWMTPEVESDTGTIEGIGGMRRQW